MMITIKEGTIATYPSKEDKKYHLQFSLRGGKTYKYFVSMDLAGAEKLACKIALSHPTWKFLEESPSWR